MKIFDPEPKYRSYDEDKTEYLEALIADGLIESGLPKKLGLSVYQIAARPIFEAYAKKNLWSLIAKDHRIYTYENEFDKRLSEGLVGLKDFSNLKKIWRKYLVEMKYNYWNNWAKLVQSPSSTGNNADEWDKIKNICIEAFATYRQYVERFSCSRELDWIDEEIECLKKEEKRKPRLKKPLPDKMDDTKFWSLIEQAKSESSGAIELFNEYLVDQLQDYKSMEIKRFQNTLIDKVEELNLWSLWALAYISQGGCSDDGFLYFRAWLITLGHDTYKQAVASEIQELLPQVPADGIAENEGLLFAAFEAYDIRSGGKEMALRERKDKPPSGEEWDETDVIEKYPEIANYYKLG